MKSEAFFLKEKFVFWWGLRPRPRPNLPRPWAGPRAYDIYIRKGDPSLPLIYRKFRNQVESGRHVEKYYAADNLENYMFDLFEGSPRTLVSFNPPPRVY